MLSFVFSVAWPLKKLQMIATWPPSGATEQLSIDDGLHAVIKLRVRQFAAAARVNPDHALACRQARAVSSYLYQLTIPRVWFDAEFLRIITLGPDDR